MVRDKYQGDFFAEEQNLECQKTASDDQRGALDQLLEQSRLYESSRDYYELLQFIVCLREFAPFNAMLLHIQKPGLTYAASATDWAQRFDRTVKRKARPLLILMPFAPVSLVYDIQDTEGSPVPESVYTFPVKGEITESAWAKCLRLVRNNELEVEEFDGGDGEAGLIEVVRSETSDGDMVDNARYKIMINGNHALSTQYATLAHELAHLFLGHLGRDSRLKIPDRRNTKAAQKEIEAESVCFIVCGRAGLESKSERYLTQFVDEHTTVEQMDLYQVQKATRDVEKHLKVAAI